MQYLQNMRILVTGGAGFIGSHLCEKLLESGDQVICVDNLFTGSKANVSHLLENSNFSFMEHDIIEPLFTEDTIDQVYNLACPASPVHYQENPVRTIKANTIGMINMLGLARKHGARILQASTSEVYGDPEVHPQTEDYRGNVNSIGPRACYDEGKRCAETLCFDYHRMHGMEMKVVRIFNTYGPRMAFDDGRVISNFILQALKGEDITIYGDGKQTRSFCYVDDLVSGLVAMMNTKKDFIGPVNLGNPDEFSIQELADKIIEKIESNSKFVNLDLPEDDPKQRQPDIAKAKEILNWEPKITLAIGLQKTIEDFKKRLV
jgi:UDP-glucuronate decarboxylase